MSTNQDVFASLATRVKASIIDSIILIFLFISIPMTIGAFTNSESTVKAVIMFAPFLILEPILVTYLGSTMGQSFFGIKVIRGNSRSNCPLYISFFRYIAKVVLGGFSLIYMLFSKKHQAIHDHLFSTFVLISPKKIEKNPEIVKYGEIEQTLSQDYTYPSAIRRFLLFIVWYIIICFVIGIVVGIGALIAIPGYTIEDDKLPEAIDIVLNFVLAIVFITVAVLASKGYLPGARRKRFQPETKS